MTPEIASWENEGGACRPEPIDIEAEAAIRCPSNPYHGRMVLRPIERQTPEQRWCGTWYDCDDPRCTSSGLIHSAELEEFLAGQRRVAS